MTLEPLSGTEGPNASAPVFHGRFDFKPDAGLRGGTYRVRISMIPLALRETLPPAQAAALPPADAVIDPAFDAKSNLKCELDRGADNTLEFSVSFL